MNTKEIQHLITRRWYLWTVITMLIITASCTKDELKLPSRLDFVFELSGLEDDIKKDHCPIKTKYSPHDILTVQSGSISIGNIEFSGRRNVGKDVYFISDISEPVTVELAKEAPPASLTFDVPQGVYNSIHITIHLSDQQTTPLTLEGIITAGPKEGTLLRFEYNYPDQLHSRAATGKPMAADIVLRKDTPSTASIIVSAEYIFRFLSPGMINAAETIFIGDEDIILVNKHININIFQQLAARVDKAITTVIE